jgi:hypothetical protein
LKTFVKEIYPEETHNKEDGKYRPPEELAERDNKCYIETEIIQRGQKKRKIS